MPYVTSLPPAPDLGFLQVPLPDLNALDETSPLIQLRADHRERILNDREDKASAAWFVDSAAFSRDRGLLEDAIAQSGQAFQCAFKESAPESACYSLAVRASALALKGDFSAAQEVVAQLKLLSDGEDEPLLRAIHEEAAATMRLRTILQDEFDEARDHYRKAAEYYQAGGDAISYIRAIAGIASSQSATGAYMDAVKVADEGLRLSAEADDWRYVGRLLLEAALAFRDQGFRHNVDQLFQLSIQWSTFLGDLPNRIRGIHGLAYLYDFEADSKNQADLQKSEQVFLDALAEGEAIGALPLIMQIRLDLTHLYAKFGEEALLQQQRDLVTQEASRLSFARAGWWLTSHDDYKQYIDGLRLDRYIARFRETIEGVLEPIFIFDPILDANGVCVDLLNEFRNSPADHLLGSGHESVRTLADLALTPYLGGLREPLLRAVSDRETFEDEISTKDDGGKAVWYVRRVVPAGEGAVVTLRNSTDSHSVAEALRIAAESARQANRAKSEFLANMSHEVRTPINGVLGLARLLIDSPLNAEQKRYVEGIISSGDILLRVIGDVLDVSKIEARSLEVEPRPVDLHRLMDEVVNLYQGQASERALDLRCDVAVGVPPVVLLDGPRVRQVLGNLVGNAVKFTPSGSIRVGLHVEGDQLEFVVQDTGIGVPEDRLAMIFEPFQQAGIQAQDEGGTGLGLTISKRLTELMGGTMVVTSRVGVGSRFSFRLPLEVSEREIESGSSSTRPDTTDFNGCSVLLVEDNPVNVLVAHGLLLKIGCDVTVAADGLEAVNALAHETFDAVLMDVRMPVMDGLHAAREIRRREVASGTHIPIIALTAGTLDEERNECFAAGMDDYLPKPFALDSLRTTLHRWIKGNELAGDASG